LCRGEGKYNSSKNHYKERTCFAVVRAAVPPPREDLDIGNEVVLEFSQHNDRSTKQSTQKVTLKTPKANINIAPAEAILISDEDHTAPTEIDEDEAGDTAMRKAPPPEPRTITPSTTVTGEKTWRTLQVNGDQNISKQWAAAIKPSRTTPLQLPPVQHRRRHAVHCPIPALRKCKQEAGFETG